MKTAIIYIIIGTTILFGALYLDVWANGENNKLGKEKCDANGGQYYHSINALNSLCKLPAKQV